MLLLVDIGNTNTKLALCATAAGPLGPTWRLRSAPERMPDDWFALLRAVLAPSDLVNIDRIIIGSVVPTATRWFAEMCRARLDREPLIVDAALDLGIAVRTDVPTETGIDRVLNGLAAFDRYGGPCLVLDCGTATKLDAVAADGAFLGGAIAPGLPLMMDALAGRTARLYQVPLLPPPSAVGSNTIHAIQSGVVLGYLAMVTGLIDRLRTELGADAPVIATGGDAPLVIARLPRAVRHEPTLTLDGLRLVDARCHRGGEAPNAQR